MENDNEGSKKKRSIQPREDVIYGTFANPPSGSNCDGGGRRSRKRRMGDLISKAELSKPVHFVSTGTVMPSQEVKRDSQEEGNRSTGVPSSCQGLVYREGFQSNRKESEGGEDQDNFLSTAIGRKIKEGAQRQEKESVRGKSMSSKMMGDKEGSGLGKLEKARAEILAADELQAKKQEQGIEVVQKVLDMRGPQVKVLSSLENFNMATEMKDNDVPMPELQYNVRLILDSTEVDLRRLEHHLTREKQKLVCLQTEKEKKLKKEMRQREQLLHMETITIVLENVKADSLSGLLTLDSLLISFECLKDMFSDYYKLFNISCIALSFAYPLFLPVFQGWQALQNPFLGVNLISSWRDLLQGDQPNDFSETPFSDSYSQLISEVFLPAVRISVANTWQARDPEPLLRFLEIWEKLLPPVILQSILENLVMPKLTTAVDSWDPQRETVPIYVWVHRWFPLLGQRLETLYPTISYKLGRVLHSWHPSDPSAYAILSPWKDVFDATSWARLMVRYIVPKLRIALQEFQIQVNTANQKLDQFNWVMTWASAIPIHLMVDLLEDNFFGKWRIFLDGWLCSRPNFDEVMQWYMGWKGLFPAELLANERIQAQLNLGLDLINNLGVKDLEEVQPGARENVIDLNCVGGVHEMSFMESIESYAREKGLLFIAKVGRYYNGLPVYGFGNISICIDSVKKLLYAQVHEGTERWGAVSLPQLLEMHRNTSRH